MIRELTEEYLESMVRLHLEVLGHTVNSRIGRGFLIALYRMAMRYGHCGIDVREDGVAGFLSYCDNRRAFTSHVIRELHMRDYARAGLSLVLHPTLLPALLRQYSFGKSVRDIAGVYITTLGVSPGYQRTGIGAELLRDMLSRTEGPVYVDTEKSNVRAQAFYVKQGFHTLLTRYGSVLLRFDRNRC